MLVHLINLLEGEILCFENAKVNEEHASKTASSPNEEDLGFEAGRARTFINKIGRCVTNCPIEEPVGSNGTGHGLCSEPEGKVLPLYYLLAMIFLVQLG
jgi:hypothetical protein